MNFLIDAHLPRRLVYRLREAGHDAVHTDELPHGNRTRDSEINRISITQRRVVVTKDEDFVNSLLIQGKPHKLLLISTGNIRNNDMDNLLTRYWRQIIDAFETYTFIELDRAKVIFHF